MELTIDQALQKGVEAHKAGQVQEADRLYTAILKAQPKHPDANHNMGVLAVGVGKVEQALPFFKTALEANPNTAQFWLSYIDTLIKLDKLADAKAVLDQAKSKGAKGDGFDKLEQRLNEADEKPVKVSKPATEVPLPQPNILDSLKLDQAIKLAKKKAKDGSIEEAKRIYQDILVKFPKNKRASDGLKAIAGGTVGKASKVQDPPKGQVQSIINLYSQGQLQQALEQATMLLQQFPSSSVLYNICGAVYKGLGQLDASVEAYNKALAIKPDYDEAYYNIGIALKGIEFQRPNSGLQKLIGSLLDQNNSVRPADIAPAAISLLKFEHNLQKHLQKPTIDKTGQSLQQTVTELSDLPLLLKLMSICPLADLGLETLLKKIRAKILLALPSFESTSGALEFQSALALQCFTNEYIYDRSAEEEKATVALEASVEATLCKGEQPSPKAILCLASYKALHEYKWCNLLTDKSEIHRVFIRQFKEPNLEIDLKSSMLVLNEITDEISTKVQAQYEDNPYPRWVNLGLPIYPKPISIIVAKSKARLFDRAICDVGEPDILVAGCGTGQHSIGTAARFKGSKVLAIDLSLSSLAYAKRKTEELGVKNIEYMQADILKLTKLGKQFDIIESAGVLHHMDNPMAGWKVLTDCLRDGGLMGIGLYSELARQSVVEMREEISQLGIGSSDSEMKSLREMIVVSNEEQHKRLMSWSDFYSLSELRDLLFHIQEHRFTIPQLKQCLAELGLKFCGFENVAVVQDFRLSNIEPDDPYDLDKWQIYEASNPSAFAGMYQFWCQKVA